jgi:hypothetical protein
MPVSARASRGALREALRRGPERPIHHVEPLTSSRDGYPLDIYRSKTDPTLASRRGSGAPRGWLDRLRCIPGLHSADANERATDLARRMVISQNLDEIEATIIPRFERGTGCRFVFYLPFYGPTLDDVARQATGFIHRLRGTSTTETGVGLGQEAGKTSQSDSVGEAEHGYTAFVAVVDCKAPYLDAGY